MLRRHALGRGVRGRGSRGLVLWEVRLWVRMLVLVLALGSHHGEYFYVTGWVQVQVASTT